MKKTTVFHLDDDKMILWGVNAMLAEYDDIAYRSTTIVEDLYKMLSKHEQNKERDKQCLLLLDLGLNNNILTGEDVLCEIKKSFPFVKVIILSVKLEEDNSIFVDLIRKGADGFALKSIEPTELYLVINKVKNSEKGVVTLAVKNLNLYEKELIEKSKYNFNLKNRVEKYNEMSDIERLIFIIACWGISDIEIHRILCSLGFFIGKRSVEKHIMNCVRILDYPRKGFYVYASLAGINIEELPLENIEGLDYSTAKTFIESKDIITAYTKPNKLEGEALKQNVKDFLTSVQIRFFLQKQNSKKDNIF